MALEDKPEIGLRERKKTRTRQAIQRAALELFRRNGYTGTTVEQISAAVDISPSTFFRYFPTKEDVVLRDEYDPFLTRALMDQPPEYGPIEAIRRAMGETFGALPASEIEDLEQRVRLIFQVPELRSVASDQFFVLSSTDADELLAARLGLAVDDVKVRTLAGCLLGVALSAMYRWADNPHERMLTVLDEALLQLQSLLKP
ncbi:acyl-CoA-like ligand-binding transcription factor [Arthrobacter bambusae]|uniref:acyl-CoA-like ligand-binding transcription factor n=1 Tax=Arthrobacter bambusae TaxID=1338426 RepID=UPI0027802C15|nr:TetR family transcriptional regulator [Arthrobacter bambusae]MDQ0028571.1 AcrR family transcriptional regulator [Arthrobacter bambusae]MDQ0096635.1 AcrR family transcriptional regulator [Arthrobacter bambusae]